MAEKPESVTAAAALMLDYLKRSKEEGVDSLWLDERASTALPAVTERVGKLAANAPGATASASQGAGGRVAETPASGGLVEMFKAKVAEPSAERPPAKAAAKAVAPTTQ